jgi:hypothetical protein
VVTDPPVTNDGMSTANHSTARMTARRRISGDIAPPSFG